MGIGVTELLILGGIPLVLICGGFVAFLVVRGSKK